ncbi:MAG TPA: GNAT family protein [Bryobacteraceae bacterium]|nr:GNAT family protein [Bryobacteraceae bacterium]
MERVATNYPDVIRVGGGIELRPLQPAHASEMYALVERNRVRLRAWLPWLTPDYSASDALRFATVSEHDNLNRTSLTSTIWFDGRICGAIGLHRIAFHNRSTSIGYWLAEEFEGRGIMTAACRAMVTHGFTAFNLHRIEIRCAAGNHRSSAIPTRLGFTEEGVLRDAEWLYDHWVDLRVFSMLEQNWVAR